MDTGLGDATVLVTGASGGIGRALTEAFAAEGARLALQGHRSFAELEAWVAQQPWRDRALAVEADVKEPAQLEAAVDAVVERWGRLDVCVANAGIWPPESLLLHESPEERIREVVDVNLMGAMWTARAFLKALARVGPRADGAGASLTFIGSTAGQFGERGHAEYAVAKSGLLGLVRTLKNEVVEVDPFARVNMVQPGWTVTHMTRRELEIAGAIAGVARTMALRQLARARDVAGAVLFLSSPALARHVSGEVITVAGGMEGRVLWEREHVDEDAVRARVRGD